MDEQPRHKLTGLAILVAIVILVPATFVGGLVGMLYKWVLCFFLYTPGPLSFVPSLRDLAMLWFPALCGGCVGGAISIYVTGALFRLANLEAVSFSVASACITFAVFFWAVNAHFVWIEISLVPYVAQIAGIVFGVFLPRFAPLE